MESVSNKTIVALLAVALIVTVVGTIVSVSKLGELGASNSFITGAQVNTPEVQEQPLPAEQTQCNCPCMNKAEEQSSPIGEPQP